MCGIYGKKGKFEINFKGKLNHRGPDEMGELRKEDVLLGSNRLAIIDIEKGKQPMNYKNLSVVFNGEIFNYKELKTTLKKLGHHFKTNCDTEILLPLYIEYGKEMVSMLDGQFSFCIYDNGNMFLARDKFGIIPLYYTKKPFVFCSEIKPLVEHFWPEINEDEFVNYLKYRYIPKEETLYKGIFKLLPGHYLYYDGKQFNVEQYYSPKIKQNKKGINYNSKRVRELLINAVNSRLMSDVPVGTLLSGGIDSTAITYIVKDKKLNSYCIGMKKNNEILDAKYTAKRLFIPLIWKKVDERDYWLLSKAYTQSKLYPFSVPNEILIKELSKEVKKTSTVVLSGEGSDEIFCGYDNLFRLARDENYKAAIKKYGYFKDDELKSLFGKEPMKLSLNKDGTDIQTFSKFMIKYHLPCLLQRLDYACMQHSVEPRPPFISKDIVEFALSIPDNQKLNGVESKIVLRKAFEGIIPHDTLYRKKVGFPLIVDMYAELNFLIKISKLNERFPGLSYVEKFKEDKLKIMFLFNLFTWLVIYEKLKEKNKK